MYHFCPQIEHILKDKKLKSMTTAHSLKMIDNKNRDILIKVGRNSEKKDS